MAKWTVSEYDRLPTDTGGNPIQIGGPSPLNEQGFTAGGQVNLNGNTRYIRFCGDTAAHVRVGAGAATTSNDYVPAGMDYWRATLGVNQINFITG